MEAAEMNAVIQPVAEEVVRQVALRGMMLAIVGGAAGLALAVLSLFLLRASRSNKNLTDEMIGYTLACIICAVLSACTVPVVCDGLMQWVAPLPTALGL